MNFDLKKKKINLLIIIFLIASTAQSFSYSVFSNYFNTYIKFSLYYIFGFIIIYLFFTDFKKTNLVNKKIKNLFIFLIIYFLVYIVFAIKNSKDYWDYKYVFENYIPWIFTFFAIFLGLNIKNHLEYLKRIFLIVFALSIFLLFFDDGNQAFVRVIASLYLFIIFTNFYPLKYKIIIISLVVSILILDIGSWRTNQLRIFYTFILYFFSYLILRVPNSVIKIYSNILLFTPIFILILFVFFNYDFFYQISLLDLKYITTENTRTFILNDILNHYNNTNSNYLFGSGGQSYFYTNFMQENMFHLNKIARYGVESGFMNLFFKNGLIGIFLILTLNFIAIKNLLTFSKNLFSKKIALLISFNWIIFFLEIPMTLQISSFLFFYLIGIGFSKEFLEMTDADIKLLCNR